MLCAAAHDSPSVDEVQGRQCHGRAVNFGHGRLGSRNALDLFKVGAKQLANFNVVKQDGIFGTHVKPELKKIYKTTAAADDDDDTTNARLILHSLAAWRRHTKIYLPTPASPPLMDVELSNW